MRAQTYQNIITVTNPGTSINIYGREQGKKRKGKKRTNITRRNAIIAKLKTTKKRIATRRRR